MISLLLASLFTFVELNCENLFDTQHDSLKNDTEFLPEGQNHWTRTRYWRKLTHIGQELIAVGDDKTLGWRLPDMVALCEVENDTVLRDLTQRSVLRTARYEYFITDSPDLRGIDVALVYQPFSFCPIRHYPIRVKPLPDMRPTRDILYVSGRTLAFDTLHVFVVHAPSRLGGERTTRRHRIAVANRLAQAIDSIHALSPQANIIVAGDFNDYTDSPALDTLRHHGLTDVSAQAHGRNGAKGTYRFRGDWRSLDHILCSAPMVRRTDSCFIGDRDFLLEEDKKYGGTHPKRCYLGPKYQNGYSDHLPLIARFREKE